MKSDMPEWAKKAQLLKSGLAFTRKIEHEVEDILIEMIGSGEPVGIGRVKTEGGRDAVVVVAVGEDKAAALENYATENL